MMPAVPATRHVLRGTVFKDLRNEMKDFHDIGTELWQLGCRAAGGGGGAVQSKPLRVSLYQSRVAILEVTAKSWGGSWGTN